MSTRSPLSDLTDYERRLAAACWPIPMSTFRALKSMFYSAVALFGMWIVVEADIGETTTIIVFTWFILFLIIYATETRELEIASGLADVTLRFFAPANVDVEPVDETDTSDETDETDDPTDR